MYKSNPSNKPKKYYALIVVLLVAGFMVTLFTLERTGVTNFYQQANSDTTTQSQPPETAAELKPTNTIDYNPSRDEDSIPIADKDPNPTTPTVTNTELTVVVTNTRRSLDQYLIKAVISGAKTATCSVTMSKGSLTVSGKSDAAMIEGQLSCKDLSIPLAQLTEPGEWNLELTVSDETGASASTTEKVIL
jgi:HSP20 family molecular chaperone IbpA